MMDSMSNIVHISSYFIVRKIAFRMENKSMNKVLSQTERETS